MAKTYDRIGALLNEVGRLEKAGGVDLPAAISAIVKKRLRVLLIDQEKQRYLSPQALGKLLFLLRDMKLLNLEPSVRLTPSGRNALNPENYNATVGTAALRLLDGFEISLSQMLDTIDSIAAPDFSDSTTIFQHLQATKKAELGFDRFRMILFLLYCTRRLSRKVRVVYGRP